jgi:hypothetical protein
MAEDAVMCEPLLRLKFPANREIYREFGRFCALNSGSMLHNPLELSEIDAKVDNSPFNRNRELNGLIREFNSLLRGKNRKLIAV